MDYLTYQKHALSIEAKLDGIDPKYAGFTADTMFIGMRASDLVDQLKKTIFYKRPPNIEAMRKNVHQLKAMVDIVYHQLQTGSIDDVISVAQFDDVSVRLIHHAFGRFGEAGELLAALHSQAMGKEFDVINYVEEMGDGGWYDPLAYDELGISEECVRTCNLAKLLVVRYNKGFSSDAATHRKLASEREVIEWVMKQYREQGPRGIGDQVLANCRAKFCEESVVA